MTSHLEATSHLPTRFGNFQISVFVDTKGVEHMTMAAG